ncbi:RluA family pseudouridine synthase [Calorimonas adulescens]|uniref:Pseudouridine synthase n=1 Tax=Calorimonas adulescens TaxID=2606906 RepID=A0A5D8QFI2_9THEO|nr:RluA family pseudouridine synthase [Calorimonas adulescens]TZE82028.1 RluA family pseudouridine synthase [Calorimonas adulescens]
MIIQSDLNDIRVDQFLALKTNFSRTYIQKLIKEKLVRINDKVIKASEKVKSGDNISIDIPPVEELKLVAEDIPIDIIYEDDDLIVVNKPKNMVVHPAPGNYSGTLVNALLYKTKNLSTVNGVVRPGIVHRLDKDTTGLIIVAKNDISHKGLAEQLKNHLVNKTYLALVDGVVKDDMGTIHTMIGRNPKERKKMAVVENGKEAVTTYNVIERLNGYTFLKLNIKTGRTHQIRVHLAYIGHPIVGDKLYGKKKNEFGINGQLLHAHKIGFIHPAYGRYMEFSAPLPEHFTDVLKKLGSKKLSDFDK